jgi:O-antigen/teichoic acid export membrane protein
MVLAMGLLNAGNYGFSVIVARILAPEEFGTYAVLYGAVVLLAVPANVLRLAIIRVATRDATASPENVLSPELMALRRDLLAFALVGGTALLFLVTFPIFAVTRDPNISSYLLAGFAGSITFTLYLDRGFLQGGLRFWWVALTIAVEVGARLGFLLLLASALDAGLLGTMAALLVGALLANAVSAKMIGRCAASTAEARTVNQRSTARTLLGYTGLMMAAYSAHTALRWLDLLAVQQIFSGDVAGQYAALSLAGKVILFAGLGITETLFTFANKAHWRRESGWPLLARALVLTALVGLPILLLYAAAPETVLEYGFGASYTGLASNLWIMGLFMFILSLSGVLVAYMIACGMAREALAASTAAVILEVILFLVFHDSVRMMVLSLCTMATFYLAVLSALIAWKSVRPAMTADVEAVPE